jgi:hypothetical protein
MFHFSAKILISLGKGSWYTPRKIEHQNLHQNKIRERPKTSESSNVVIFHWFWISFSRHFSNAILWRFCSWCSFILTFSSQKNKKNTKVIFLVLAIFKFVFLPVL